jgi:hypothetical protein
MDFQGKSMIFMNFQRKFCSDSKQNEPHGSFEGHFDPQGHQKSGTFEGPPEPSGGPLGGSSQTLKASPKDSVLRSRPQERRPFWAVRGSFDPLGQHFELIFHRK